MRKFETVVKVEVQSESRERVVKSKTSTRKDGVTTLEETIYKRTVTGPVALLSCGHWRGNVGYGTDVRTAKRMECYECARIARETPNVF
jgi:hypothetical protein